MMSRIDEAIDELVEAKLPRPSTRPTKQVRSLVDRLDRAYAMLEGLQQQYDAISAQVKAVEAEIGSVEKEILPFLREYKDNTVKLRNILVKLQETAPKKSPTPQWRKFIDWAFERFGQISAEMRKEAEQFLESTKRMLPGKTKIIFKREESTISEKGEVSRLRRISAEVDALMRAVTRFAVEG